MDKSKLQTFILLEKERRALEDKVKAIKAETAQLQQDILDEFSAMGIQRITMNGLTAYVFNDNSLRITDRAKQLNYSKKRVLGFRSTDSKLNEHEPDYVYSIRNRKGHRRETYQLGIECSRIIGGVSV